MTRYEITNKSDIRNYIINGINPGKTLYFNIADNDVNVSLRFDDELEEVYIRECHGLKKLYYTFESLISDLERLFDTLINCK